ncbi:MAG: hypothetical protein V4494_00305 [Chlamydiota bacterium]
MSIRGVGGTSIHGTLTGGIFSALSIAIGSIGRNAAMKTQREASKTFQKREIEKAGIDAFSNKLLVAWGASGVMEWVSHFPGSVFSKIKVISNIFGRAISCALSGVRVYGNIRDLIFFEKLTTSNTPTVLRAFAEHQMTLTSLTLIGDLCFIGYFALEIASILIGAAFVSGLSNLLLLAGIIFLIAGVVYMTMNGVESSKKIMGS